MSSGSRSRMESPLRSRGSDATARRHASRACRDQRPRPTSRGATLGRPHALHDARAVRRLCRRRLGFLHRPHSLRRRRRLQREQFARRHRITDPAPPERDDRRATRRPRRGAWGGVAPCLLHPRRRPCTATRRHPLGPAARSLPARQRTSCSQKSVPGTCSQRARRRLEWRAICSTGGTHDSAQASRSRGVCDRSGLYGDVRLLRVDRRRGGG